MAGGEGSAPASRTVLVPPGPAGGELGLEEVNPVSINHVASASINSLDSHFYGVLLACLVHPDVAELATVTRRAFCGHIRGGWWAIVLGTNGLIISWLQEGMPLYTHGEAFLQRTSK